MFFFAIIPSLKLGRRADNYLSLHGHYDLKVYLIGLYLLAFTAGNPGVNLLISRDYKDFSGIYL